MDWALGALALAGVSDWADGWLARRLGLQTVLGSYLDPLADKALTVCVLLALAAKGTLPAWLAAVAVGRDCALVGGALLSRAAALGWRWRGAREFFRMVPGDGEAAAPAAPPVEPLLVSKANTALTFALVAAALAHDGWGVPDAEALAAGAAAVGATTAMSGAAYLVLFLRRRAGLPPPA
jgi:cardiolipin synthase